MITKTESDEIVGYLSDAANYKGSCEAVYFPETAEEVSEILKEANRTKTKITVSGNGTGLTGGRVPLEGKVLATDKLNKIISVEPDAKIAAVEPGVLLSDFKRETEEKQLFYPPDPTENECYIGGTIATNASGAKSFKYGATRNFVEYLEVVLPQGDFLELERGKIFADKYDLRLKTKNGVKIELKLPEFSMPKVKHAAGYFVKKNMDAIDLFIGAEGTLGVITKAKLRLLELPREIISAVIFFRNENDALEFIAEARELSYTRRAGGFSEIDALALEYFDNNALSFLLEEFPNIKENHAAAVWFEQDVTEEDYDSVTSAWFELIEKHGGDTENSWFAVDAGKRREFAHFRHAVSQKISEYIAAKGFKKVGTDTAVPHDKFREFYFTSKSITEKSGLKFVVYGHFGDSHMHLNMLPATEEEFSKAKNIYRKICKLAAELGGTVSAEHGIGKLKREYLELMYSYEELKSMAEIKKTLDPNLILNFGNIFLNKHFQ